jgi:leader peptidase (prepilin peptidase) / N-methyltransferase
MTGAFVFCGVVFGLVLGSFLNVVVYRTPMHLSIVRPGSFCPRCDHEISPIDNVPVLSWLVLRGRCRSCRNPISVRYPLVEAGTAAAFAGIAATLRPLFGIPGFWAMSVTIAVVAVIDADHGVCPSSVPAIGTGIGIAAFVVGAALTRHPGPVADAGFGFLAAGLLAAVLASAPLMRKNLGESAVLSLPAFGACVGWLGAVPALIGSGSSVAFVCLLSLRAVSVPAAARADGRSSAPLVGSPDPGEKRTVWCAPPLAISLVVGVVAALAAAGLGA